MRRRKRPHVARLPFWRCRRFFDLLRSDLIFFAHCRHGAARLDRGDHGGGEDGVDDGGGEDGQWWCCWWRGLVKERSQAKVCTWA